MKVNFNCALSSGIVRLGLLLVILQVVACSDPDRAPRDAAADVIEPVVDASGLCGADRDAGIEYAALETISTNNLRHDVSVAIAANVIVPQVRALEASLGALVCATLSYAESPADPATKAAAQQQWRDTMSVLQRLNGMELGPAGPPNVVVGGTGLGDEIYAWPLVNRCKMDELTVSLGYQEVDAVRALSVNARGLASMEHLLFGPIVGNECASNSPINISNMWSALPAAEKDARRARYAHNVALVALSQATALRNAWEPASGNYYQGLVSPGGSSPYSDAQQLLNGLSDALFYVYSDTRDMKVARPAGINSMDGVQPGSVESPEADASLDHIRDNIIAFRLLFTGGEPGSTNLGFDDLLVSIGQGQVATDIVTAADNALAAANAVTGTLEDAVVNRPAEVQALYDALKGISDLLKTQFITVLGLQAPMSAAGDND